MDLKNVKFLWCSDEINKNPDKYWSMVMDMAQRSTLNRVIKCCTAMGRKEEEREKLQASQIFYPCMQATDIFYLGADICQLGLDQRKVNTFAIEYAMKVGLPKPVVISHHMMYGLKEGQLKMSKSDPDSAIFMEDSVEDVNRKIKQAFCPEKIVHENPIFDYIQYLSLIHI